LVKSFPPRDKNISLLGNKERIYLIDWLSFIAAELLLRKNTLHLAVAFIDGFIFQKGAIPQKMHAFGAGALLLAVKQ
jgi:ABC-type maltose transport system permease subunit